MKWLAEKAQRNLPRLFFLAVLFLPHLLTAQVEAPKADAGIFKRENQTVEWKEQVRGVDYSPDKDIKLKFGDVLATKDKSAVFHFGGFELIILPFSVFRIQGVEGQEDMAAVPELLFGEALFRGQSGQSGFLLLPGQSVEFQGIAYLTVDEEKYSIVASIQGTQKIIPVGSSTPLELTQTNLMELGPAGETGESTPMAEEDIKLYSEQTPPEDAPRVSLNANQKNITFAQLAEYWSRERVTLLVNGPETPAGLAIASGEVLKARNTAAPAETVQVFDKDKGSTTKILTFSGGGGGGGDKTAAGVDLPQLSNVTIAGKNATIGDTLNLTFKDLEDKSFAIKGKAKAADPEAWTLVMKINGDETRLPSLSSFENTVRVQLENIEIPKVFGVMIGEDAAQTITEDTILTREKLSSGKLEITGNATPGQNRLNYTIQMSVKDKDEKDYTLGTFQVILDLAELNRVEVSLDNGSAWNKAKGTDDWTYSYTPSNGEKYKVKIRAYDVMENVSEDQFEAYIFTYRYKTDAEVLREVFDAMMRAFRDKDRSTFMRSASQDFSTNITDLRDGNELESSLDLRFRCCSTNIQYTIKDVEADQRTTRGSVDFNWTDRNASNLVSNYALFNYVYEDGQWLLHEVVDPNTFLHASRVAGAIEMSTDNSQLVADGVLTSNVTARVLDNAGGIVADGVEVRFSTDNGSVNPAVTTTVNGYAYTIYTTSTTPGTATISAVSGDVSSSASLTLTPIQPPLPPD